MYNNIGQLESSVFKWKSDVYGFPFTNAIIVETYACSGQLIHMFIVPNKPKLVLQNCLQLFCH
jgi:hypothetical protein